MFIVSYDISSDRKRSKFSKFLQSYGEKVQYSVYTIKNSPRILGIVLAEIEHRYRKTFEPTDSIYIFRICDGCMKKIVRYGSASHEEKDVVFLD